MCLFCLCSHHLPHAWYVTLSHDSYKVEPWPLFRNREWFTPRLLQFFFFFLLIPIFFFLRCTKQRVLLLILRSGNLTFFFSGDSLFSANFNSHLGNLVTCCFVYSFVRKFPFLLLYGLREVDFGVLLIWAFFVVS